VDIDAANHEDTVVTNIRVTTELGGTLGIFGPFTYVGSAADSTVIGPFTQYQISNAVAQNVGFTVTALNGGDSTQFALPIDKSFGSAKAIFSAKQKPTAFGGGYVQLATPVIPVESRSQAGRRTGIQYRRLTMDSASSAE
jgi:hypothetical protein